MKSIYIIALLLLSVSIYAQESKTSETQDQSQVLKNAKEQEAQLLKDSQQNMNKKPAQSGLASDQGLEVKKQDQKPKTSVNNSGKQLSNTATFDEVLATIPNRQSRKPNNSRIINTNVTGLPNTASLQEIKKTIPKN